ncbi:MAG: hypothetical protein JGK26_22435 [Microcoleus sp. PH2017_27_LUM_O_A]|uniref:hypothetical protein n=1 Tax=unclassified Microcoleus TaxID=2642155 RepID=UPI001D8C69B6|nr:MULTISPECIES: hypothetical protein [unclassified Microcoleus]MCC3462436.1 hypothetical protein [Microcoleus sp. PH2017_11_PCY_U_A]MCC3527079.1 hypothetical protein [Microcoleus sp. PH2017_21_RUC_O_A]MCC3540272.1 hypothetical protein [Microcoleus sp. PH2017_22_RUC_O_B]MCC3561840.1 hypothetical protein [Microcoleus sp. PH2017_27_LUM_O_A]
MNNKQKEFIGIGCVSAIVLLFGFIGITVWELRVFLGIHDDPLALTTILGK